MDNITVGDYLTEKNCSRCGKIYIPTPEWLYRDNGRGYCSWTCYNHRNDGKKCRYKAVEYLLPDGTVLHSFQSASKAAEWFGTSPFRIINAIDKGTQFKGYLWRYKE